MKKEKSTQGFGLAVFSLVVLGLAFIGLISGKKISVIASIVSILSVVFAAAAYFEARRAKGAKTFTLITLIITLAATYLILVWTRTIDDLPFFRPTGEEEVTVMDTNINDATKLIEKAEELEDEN